VVNNQSGGLIYGQNDSGIAVEGLSSNGAFTVTINNDAGATIQTGGTQFAAIHTGADDATINDSGTIDGSTSGSAILGGSGNNTVHISGGSASILGSMDGGVGGTNVLTIDPGAGNNFVYSGIISDFSRVDVLSGMVVLSGISTYTGTTHVTGGTLNLDGAHRLSASSNLDLNGGTLETSDAGGADGEDFNCLSLSNSSTIDLESTSLTFACLGAVGAGDTLTVMNYSFSVSPNYIFRFLGDLTGNSAFLNLVGDTTVNGSAVSYIFDGTYTDVVTPEPSTLALIGLGAGLLFLRRRRGLDCN